MQLCKLYQTAGSDLSVSNMDSMESKYSSGDSCVSQRSDLAIQQARARFEQVDQRLCCPVCLVRFRDPRLLNCTHSFCKDCLLDVLAKKMKNMEYEKDREQGKTFYIYISNQINRLVVVNSPDYSEFIVLFFMEKLCI